VSRLLDVNIRITVEYGFTDARSVVCIHLRGDHRAAEGGPPQMNEDHGSHRTGIAEISSEVITVQCRKPGEKID